MVGYNHKEIEQKWQKYWDEHETFKAVEDTTKPKYYALDMFPYPSGQGLHVGHPEGYTATDIVSRYKRMRGFNVLHPMGWDSFGLPAEQYALKTGNNPADFTDKNIANFKRQIKSLGLSYDWTRELKTTDPKFYKWTQWIFEKLYEKGLAYEAEMMVNWAPDFPGGGIVVANEEVVDGKTERGGYPVYRVPMKQWVLKITEYADRLVDDLEELDWPKAIKEMQKNWIGRSYGASVFFNIENSDKKIEVFTTRADTLFGASYVVLAPEHELIDELTTPEYQDVVASYKEEISKKSDLERTDLNKDKTGVFTGSYVVNPVSGEKLPIWIADYVLASYGTGAVMAVPAHDQRDWEFAKKYDLPLKRVIEGGNLDEAAFGEDGAHVNSDFLNGMNIEDANKRMIEELEKIGAGSSKVNYKLRDWIFSRQRYWGEPIPVIHWEDGTMTLVPENELPLRLPELTKDEMKPSGTGESPLANATEWLEVDGAAYGKPGIKGRRETNTMPQWAGSSWYFIRYMDANNEDELVSEEAINYWQEADLYVGGAEHAVLHLLYARFWHKVLYDLGIVKTKEPFKKLVNQGMILGSNNEKMSKSKGNVVNPDDIVEEFGADTLRTYEMFMGPLEQSIAWSEDGISGSRRWLDRVWRLFINENNEVNENVVSENDDKLNKVYAETVKKVTESYEKMSFNTAISQMMIFVNEAYKAKTVYVEYAKGFVKLLSPIAPHLAEELWSMLGNDETITYQEWPTYDEKFLQEDNVEIVVQVNGKVRGKLVVPVDADRDTMIELAQNDENVQRFIEGKDVKKYIAIPGKIVNIVIG